MGLTYIKYLVSAFSLLCCMTLMMPRRVTAEIEQHDDLEIQQQDDLASNEQLLEKMKNSKSDLTSLRNALTGIDDYLKDYQKRTCQFGLNSHHCALSRLDNYMSAADWLNSMHSPGKRSLADTDPELAEKYNRLLQDIYNKREQLAVLKSLLEAAENKVNHNWKRTCLLNLGGRCATELASAMADQYYYLNGPNSPGKRRRRSIHSL